MKSLNGNSLLGVALAGISCLTHQASAASVFNEVTDFGNGIATATDLSAEFANFSAEGGIVGKLVLNNLTTDFADYFVVNAAALSVVNIPFTCMSSNNGAYFGFNVFTTSGSSIGNNGISLPTPGVTYDGVISFTVPENGKVVFGTSQESGDTTLNYTLGAVPEPTTGLLSLAAVAAAALRRRREAL